MVPVQRTEKAFGSSEGAGEAEFQSKHLFLRRIGSVEEGSGVVVTA